MQLIGNDFHGNFSSIYVDSGSQVTATGNVFTGGQGLATIYVSTASTVQLNGNHILKDGTLAVELRWFFNSLVTQDMTNNYWGTTDVDSIASWIQDVNDDPAIHSIVDFEPIAEEPLPTERSSWGSLKALFR